MSEPNTFHDERRSLEKVFKAEWGNTSEVKYENMPWEDPKGLLYYLAFFVRPGPGKQVSLNTKPLHRYSGTVIAQVFQKERTGTGEVDKLAGKFAEIFRGRTFCLDDSGLLRFDAVSLQIVGTNMGWYQANVTCPYMRDAYHSRPTT